MPICLAANADWLRNKFCKCMLSNQICIPTKNFWKGLNKGNGKLVCGIWYQGHMCPQTLCILSGLVQTRISWAVFYQFVWTTSSMGTWMIWLRHYWSNLHSRKWLYKIVNLHSIYVEKCLHRCKFSGIALDLWHRSCVSWRSKTFILKANNTLSWREKPSKFVHVQKFYWSCGWRFTTTPNVIGCLSWRCLGPKASMISSEAIQMFLFCPKWRQKNWKRSLLNFFLCTYSWKKNGKIMVAIFWQPKSFTICTTWQKDLQRWIQPSQAVWCWKIWWGKWKHLWSSVHKQIAHPWLVSKPCASIC